MRMVYEAVPGKNASQYVFPHRLKVLDDSLGRYYITDLTDDMKAWMKENVGEYARDWGVLGQYILFHDRYAAFAFMMRWA